MPGPAPHRTPYPRAANNILMTDPTAYPELDKTFSLSDARARLADTSGQDRRNEMTEMQTTLPSLDELVGRLSEFAGPGAPALSAGTALADLADLGIESLDLLEWLYEVGADHDLDVDETVFDGLGEGATLADLYEVVLATTSTQ